MAKYRRSGLARYRWECHREWSANLLTEVATLEGRLQAALGLDPEAFRAIVYGEEYLAPWERYDRLLKMAAEVGV